MSKNKLGIADWKTQRRLQALNLKRKGWKQKDIATALDVTKGAVSQWLTTAAALGEVALESRPHCGRPSELIWDEKQLIPEFLSHGAEAYGFRREVWTCPRVRKVIEWEFDVSYHKSHVARLLKELKWTPQLPVERATQRDEVAIAEWYPRSSQAFSPSRMRVVAQPPIAFFGHGPPPFVSRDICGSPSTSNPTFPTNAEQFRDSL